MSDRWVSDCGRATLYLGDCMDVLKAMPDSSIDSIVSDPPYALTGHVCRKGQKAIDSMAGSWNENPVDTSEYGRTLKTECSVALFHGTRQNIEIDGFKKVDSFFLVKNNPPPRCRPGFCSAVEMCDVFSRIDGKRKWHGGFCEKNYWFGCGDAHSKTHRWNHPAQKPLQAMVTLVNCITQFDETVLDPFMGSGTTGVACLRTGRRFIGIEIDEGYFATAKRRIQEELAKQAEMLDFGAQEAAV